jgi:Flp pilus assembly protein TadG
VRWSSQSSRRLRRQLRRTERGGAFVEFALIAPVLMLMALATFEMHGLLRASETAARAALQTADLVARETVTTATELNDMRALTRKSLGLADAQAGSITIQIASIGFNTATGASELRWRNVSGSTLPITLSDADGLGGKGESVIQVIAVYDHTSAFSFLFPTAMRFRDVAWARPRNTRMITLDGVT